MLTPGQQDAVRDIARAAIACERATGCPAEVSAAQCIFESDYLRRMPGNNCFGIKRDHRGAGSQYTLTHEFLNGRWIMIPMEFEVYKTLADCFLDHARLIQTGVYANAWYGYRKTHDVDGYIAGVAAHYATDPLYARKITAEAHSPAVETALQQMRAEVVS